MHVENMCTLSPNYQDKLDRWFRMKHRWQCVLNGQSSPGILQVGQQPSYGTRQMPHTSPSLSSSTSSLPVSQRHCAMACQRFTVTFISAAWWLKEGEACQGIEVYLHTCDRRVTSAKSLASIQIRPLDDIKEKLAFPPTAMFIRSVQRHAFSLFLRQTSCIRNIHASSLRWNISQKYSDKLQRLAEE